MSYPSHSPYTSYLDLKTLQGLIDGMATDYSIVSIEYCYNCFNTV